VIGADVVALLQEQLTQRGINMTVRALANDTVGTMEAAASHLHSYPPPSSQTSKHWLSSSQLRRSSMEGRHATDMFSIFINSRL